MASVTLNGTVNMTCVELFAETDGQIENSETITLAGSSLDTTVSFSDNITLTIDDNSTGKLLFVGILASLLLVVASQNLCSSS